MIEFGIVKGYVDGPEASGPDKKTGILTVLDPNGKLSDERLEFDGSNGHVAYYDSDEDIVDLINDSTSRAYLSVDMTPETPAPGVEIAFERVSIEVGYTVGRWAIADHWRSQSQRIGKPPFSYDEGEH